jgi:hypothetical protein
MYVNAVNVVCHNNMVLRCSAGTRVMNVHIQKTWVPNHCICLDYDFETARFQCVKNGSADKRFFQNVSGFIYNKSRAALPETHAWAPLHSARQI